MLPERWPNGATDEASIQLRIACEWDLEAFASHFLPHWCPDAFNQVHLDYYEQYKVRAGSRGHRDVVAAPRGSSKTTGCVLVGVLHDCVYQTESFIVYITNRFDNARDKVRQVRDELEGNAELVRVYGSLVSEPWNQDDFTTALGTRVLAGGRNSQFRGITSKAAQRPTKIIADDVEHMLHVFSEEQRYKDDVWLQSDILRLGQPRTNVAMFGTVLHPDSLLAKTLKNPGWSARLYQSVQTFSTPESVPYWQQWRQLFITLDNPTRQADARAFFEAHVEVMLDGVEVLWPERQDYYALMIARLVDGESAWNTELMNNPLGDSRYLFDLDQSAYCLVHPEGLERASGVYLPFLDIREVAAYIDCTPDKKDIAGSDYACCVVGMKDKAGYEYILDTYLAQEGSTATQIAHVVDLLWRWQVPKLGVEANGFQSLMAGNIREAVIERAQQEGIAWQVDMIPIQNMRNKVLRITSLEPRLANGWLQFARTLPAEFYRQFREFIPVDGAGHDDAPDAVEGLVRVLNGLYDARSVF